MSRKRAELGGRCNVSYVRKLTNVRNLDVSVWGENH